MSGKLVLLSLIAGLFWFGATIPIHAQEKVTLISRPENRECTLLQDYLVTQKDNCDVAKLTQFDRAIKDKSEQQNGNQNLISYDLETGYYEAPTETPTPQISQTPNLEPQTPQDNVPAEGSNLNSDVIFELINQHRADIGKPAFIHDDALCSLANTRSLELHGELFEGKGYLHEGLYDRNLSYWITEDAKWGSNEAGTVQWWLNSPIHRAAIEGEYTYSCGACNGSMCSQLFTSYTPKQAILSPSPAIADSE